MNPTPSISSLSAVVVAVLIAPGHLAAATIVDETYSVNTTAGSGDWTANGNTTPTWTIDPGVTVSTAERFFINDGANFTISGGGSLVSSTNNTYAGMRIGSFNGTGNGFVTITGGSTFEFTNSAAQVWAWAVDEGGITLDGVGSTFIAAGTYNAGTGKFEASGTTATEYGVAISVSNGSLQVNDLGGGFTELTVVPESSVTLLGGIGALLLLRRRRGA
jgi:hypothetical protein